MKRLFILLPLLALTFVGWSQQKSSKNKNIQVVPHGTLQPMNVPEIGVPTATQPLEANTAIKPVPFLQKRSALLPSGFKIKTSVEGLPTMIEGSLQTTPSREIGMPAHYPAQKNVEDRVFQYLNVLANAIQIKKPSEEFVIKSIETDEIGQTHVRLQQVLGNVPVWGSDIIVHETNGKVTFFNGIYFPTPSVNSLEPTVLNPQAEQAVRSDLEKKTGFTTLKSDAKEHIGGEQLRSELVIFHKDEQRKTERLAWHVVAYPNVVHRYEYFVDAQNGEILDSYHSSCTLAGHIHGLNENEKGIKNVENMPKIVKNMAHPDAVGTEGTSTNTNTVLDGAFTATALDLLNISRTINTYQVGTKYYMLDASRSMFNLGASVLPNKPVGAIQTFDYNNTDNGPYYYVSTTNNTWTNQKTAVSAHYNGGKAYDYYKTTFNRNSINNQGGTIKSFINVTDGGISMDNAYWNGEAMFYGNGSQAFLPLARGLDVAGHEISHGVIQNTANLVYKSEPGALNESFADIFGCMIDRDDWQIGEDVVNGRAVFSTGFLRDLSNPNNGGTGLSSNGWQPKHVNEQYKGTQDNGGVHINSGIPNYAFYLFATNAAVGKPIAEKVFYRALTFLMTASMKFIDCRSMVEQACKDLYPANTAILTAAQNAFAQVGIGSGGAPSGIVYQQDLPVNLGSDWVVYINNDSTKLQLTNGTGSSVLTLSNRGAIGKPSISDNGKYIFYIGRDRKMYYLLMDYSTNPPTFTDKLFQNLPIWKNVAVSKDGTKIAANDGTDTIWVYSNVLGGLFKGYKLYNPTFSTGVSAGAVLYSDVLEWDHFGTSILYDAFSRIKGQVSADDIEYWNIGSIDVWSNQTNNWLATPKIEKLFSNLPEYTGVASPTYAKNSPYIIAFDFIDDSVTPSDYYILSLNTQTGGLTQAGTGIYLNNTDNYPSFSRTDNRILFTKVDNFNNHSLNTITLSSNKLEPVGTSSLFKTDASYGNWFATGTRVLSAVGDLAKTAIEVSPNPFSDNLSVSVTSETTGKGKIEVYDLLGRAVNVTPLSILVGKNSVSLDTHNLQAGTYLLKISIDDKSRTTKIVKF
jgi:bacillolysin